MVSGYAALYIILSSSQSIFLEVPNYDMLVSAILM